MLKVQHPKVLVIGAGAVGQVYGYHMTRGGAEVSVLVKPKYRDEALGGWSLKQHRLFGMSQKSYRWVPHQVFTSLREAKGIWHQVWLAVPSPALSEPWIQDLQHCVGDATVVLLTPGINDFQILSEHYPANKIVSGMISMVSYAAPLPGQNLEKCTAYFFPPFSPSPFQGPPERATSAAEFLQRGGCPASVVKDARIQGALASSIMMPMIVGLEQEGWELKRFLNSATFELSLEAATQALAIVKREFALQSTKIERLLNPKLLKFGLSMAPVFAPFPLEPYLQVHFTKVRSQTDQMMQRYIMLSERHDLPAAKITSLYAQWRRGDVAASLSQSFPAVTSADSSLAIGVVNTVGLDEETEP